MESDIGYFQDRLLEERIAAEASNDPRVRRRHCQFAEAYEVRLRELSAEQRRSDFHLVHCASAPVAERRKATHKVRARARQQNGLSLVQLR
jgi:hypothetical protein